MICVSSEATRFRPSEEMMPCLMPMSHKNAPFTRASRSMTSNDCMVSKECEMAQEHEYSPKINRSRISSIILAASRVNGKKQE